MNIAVSIHRPIKYLGTLAHYLSVSGLKRMSMGDELDKLCNAVIVNLRRGAFVPAQLSTQQINVFITEDELASMELLCNTSTDALRAYVMSLVSPSDS